MMKIPITGVGAVTSVGLSAPATCAALRAGIARITPLETEDTHGTVADAPPPVGGRVPLEWFQGGPVEEEWPGHERFGATPPDPEYLKIEEGIERLVRLAVPAATECWSRAGGEGKPPDDWGLYLGLDAEEDPETLGKLHDALLEALGGFAPRVVEMLRQGRAAGLAGLFRAATAIQEGRISGAIVGAMDSLLRPSVRQRLLEAEVLMDPDANPQGVIPGEGAAFCVLEREPGRSQPLSMLVAASVSQEPTVGTGDPNQGEGLTLALQALRGAVPLAHSPLVVCDLNGDRYRAMEWGLTYVRVLGDLHGDPEGEGSGELWHPADCTGDTGAAAGVLNCVWVTEALDKGYAGGDGVMIWGASDGPLRAGVMLGKPS